MPVVLDQDGKAFQGALGQLGQERSIGWTLAALVFAQRDLRQACIEPALDVVFLQAHDASAAMLTWGLLRPNRRER